MPLRRTVLTLTAACLIAAVAPAARAQTQEQASAFIQNVGNQLVSIVNSSDSPAQKSAALTKIIENDVDVDGVARFVLGRFWRLATPQQQREYESLFHKVLVDGITAKIGDYAGVRFTVGRTAARSDGQMVSSTIASPNKPPTNVDWLVQSVNGSPKIADVVAEGTSLRLTQRDDYASFMVQHHDNIQALLDALRRQASANG